MYQLSDYDYTLPEELIAQTPAEPPESCKLLVYETSNGQLQDRIFSDITQLIDPDTLIIFNNSKVVKARIPLPSINGEIFYLQHTSPYSFEALVRPGKKFKLENTIQLNDSISFTVEKITPEGRKLTCSHPILSVLEKYGQMPLPPYISYDESKADPYQPIFAEKEGSVASPTASLHFSASLLEQLTAQGIQTTSTTLHVGLGTFKQVDVEDITTYDIHEETIEIEDNLFTLLAQQKIATKPILAIGTTVTRTLESLPYLRKILQENNPDIITTYDEAVTTYWRTTTQDISTEEATTIISKLQHQDGVFQFSSKLFLYPGKSFHIIDQLITNFHLPKSSLLMLVAGLVGYDEMKQLYAHAIAHQYRFYSFGDAMWLK